MAGTSAVALVMRGNSRKSGPASCPTICQSPWMTGRVSHLIIQLRLRCMMPGKVGRALAVIGSLLIVYRPVSIFDYPGAG